MDIMYLVDRLEALVNSSRRVPLSSRIMLEEDDVLAIVEQMRQTITNEGILNMAKERGEQVLSDAQRDAQATRSEIEEYAVEVLGTLEQQLQLQLHQVRNGLQELAGHSPQR